MKKICVITSILSFICGSAQIVNIPDANFKNALVNTNCAHLTGTNNPVDVDSNDDGEIQMSEAMAIDFLNIDNRMIADLTGIESFTSLRYLYANINDLTSVDFTALAQLEGVQMAYNQITAIAANPNIQYLQFDNNFVTNGDFLNNLPNLRFLSFSSNQIANYQLPGPLLTDLYCSNNQLTSLDGSNGVLQTLVCNHNQITSLLLPQTLKYLVANNNALTELDLSGLTMRGINVSYNQLSTLTIPPHDNVSPVVSYEYDWIGISGNLYTEVNNMPVRTGSFFCNDTQIISLKMPGLHFETDEFNSVSNNPHLQYIDAKNGHLSHLCIPDDEPFGCKLTIENNPELSLICFNADELENTDTQQYLRDHNNPDLNFTAFCSFIPEGYYNTISGNVSLDIPGAECTSGAAPASGVTMLFLGSGVYGPEPTTDLSGNFVTYPFGYSQGLNPTIRPQTEEPYFTFTPESYISAFTGTHESETVNFCMTPNGIHPDLEINLIPLTDLVPGQDATIRIVCHNKGTEIQSPTVMLNYDDGTLDFVGATSIPNVLSTGVAVWNFSDHQPLQNREITITFHVHAGLDQLPVNVGDTIAFSSEISSSLIDEKNDDNVSMLNMTVQAVQNGTQKFVAEKFAGDPDDYLHYTIRFQNTNIATAQNVVVTDNVFQHEPRTFQLISTSHPCRVSKYGATLEFIFENINLPPSSESETESRGYVSFKVKPDNFVIPGEQIENIAKIYYDYNPAIETNTVTTTVSQLATTKFETESIGIYPNPASQSVTLSINSGKLKDISIYNSLGQLVKHISGGDKNSVAIDISELTGGTYFVKVASDKGTVSKKLVKL